MSVKDDGPVPADLGAQPFVAQDGPQRLVDVLAVFQERAPQQPFLHGAKLPERAVPTAVPGRGTRLQTMHTDHVEYKIHDKARPVDEDPGAPELGPDGEAPLGRAKRRLERTHLKQADGHVGSVRHDGVAEILPYFTLSLRVQDEF